MLRESSEMEALEGVDVLKTSEFALNGSLHRLLNLPLPEFVGLDDSRERENVLGSLIEMHMETAVRYVFRTRLDPLYEDDRSYQ